MLAAGFFTDSFTDGNEPPSAPNFLPGGGGGAASYNVFGTIPSTAESGGKLLLDTANGSLAASALDEARIAVNVRLLTDFSTNLALGLKSDDTLSLTGTFSSTTPSGVLNPVYGIRFNDNSGAGSHQVLSLHVTFRTATSLPEIRYILQDFDANTITVLGSAPFAPPVGADEILLNISRPSTANDNFLGSFAYVSLGSVGAATTFASPGQMFQGENFVRAEFNATDGFGIAAVPEPATLWLVGLAGLFLLVGRRRANR